MADKSAFRAAFTAREQALSEAELLASDAALRARFLALPWAAEAKVLLLFAGMGREVDTAPLMTALLHQGKQVLLPRCLPGHEMEARVYQPGRLVRHKYGMLEPDTGCPAVPKEHIDLILVPALCYDRGRYRCGRGGGYYDRYLAGYAGRTVGLCRQALLADQVPRQDWDLPVGLVLTETETF